MAMVLARLRGLKVAGESWVGDAMANLGLSRGMEVGLEVEVSKVERDRERGAGR